MKRIDNKQTVGIMTFWSSDENYGQLLQAYALSSRLERMGFNVFLVRYDGISDKTLNDNKIRRLLKGIASPIKLLRAIVGKIASVKLVRDNDRREFDRFRQNHLKFSRFYKTYRELSENPPSADFYICGSDMIWCAQNKMKPYYLQFVPSNVPKIAYAPSFGRKNISKEYKRAIKRALEEIDYISVREDSAVEVLNDIGILSKHMPDPTILLESDDYLTGLSIKRPVRHNQLFAYILGNESDFSSKYQERFCEEYGMNYLYVSAHGRKDTYKQSLFTIEQWIEAIASSKYFVTNSFHGCIFAILFRTPFLFYPLTGVKSDNNERIYSLLSKLGLEDRIFKGNMNLIFDEIDFDRVHSIIDLWRNEGIKFLKDALLDSINKD